MGGASSQATPLTAKQVRDQRLREMLKQMDEASLEPQLVRLGDASIASPFTSRHSSISCSELCVCVFRDFREGFPTLFLGLIHTHTHT